MPRKETYSGPISAQAQQDLVSDGIENFELPTSVVLKIAKASIPDNVRLPKETVLSLVKGSTVFINNLAANAYDVAQSKQHKSISASDILKALETNHFGDMVSNLQEELLIFRELSKNNKGKKLTTTNGGSGSASAKKGLGVAGGSSASASTAKSKSKETPTGEGSDNGVSGIPFYPPPAHVHPGPYTSTPLDLPTAHSPMDVDYDAEESVSVVGAVPRLPIAAEYPSCARPRVVDREVSSDEDLEW